jgi:transposase
VDGHPSHKARKVQKFIESVSDKFSLFFLPPYSPELNPDERVWNDLKNNVVGRHSITSLKEMRSIVTSFLRSLLRNKDRIKAYYNDASTRYAVM